MTLKKLLYAHGVQLEHIYRIENDFLSVRLSQIDNTHLPVSGLYGKKVLPYLDTNMYLDIQQDKLVAVVLQGGDFSKSITLLPNGEWL